MSTLALASGDGDMKTPWAKIAEDPLQFFDADCFPDGFKFEDPSRMGREVKKLLRHLRERQETLGVNAFHFKRFWKDKEFHPAKYPQLAQQVIDAGAEAKDWAGPPTISDETLPTTEDASAVTITPAKNKRKRKSTKSKKRKAAAEETTTSNAPTNEVSTEPTAPTTLNELNPTPTPMEMMTPLVMATSSSTVLPTVLPTITPAVDESSSLTAIDPRLLPHSTNLPPVGDPFPTSSAFVLPPTNPTTSAIKIDPPSYSPSSTPAKSPRKRKLSEFDSPAYTPDRTPRKSKLSQQDTDMFYTPTTSRRGRTIVTPSRFR
jgi:hypothetical protein